MVLKAFPGLLSGFLNDQSLILRDQHRQLYNGSRHRCWTQNDENHLHERLPKDKCSQALYCCFTAQYHICYSS
jgi:hypothetical protein